MYANSLTSRTDQAPSLGLQSPDSKNAGDFRTTTKPNLKLSVLKDLRLKSITY